MPDGGSTRGDLDWVVLVDLPQIDLWVHLVASFEDDPTVRVATTLAEDEHSAKIRRGLRLRSAVLLRASEFQGRYGASR